MQKSLEDKAGGASNNWKTHNKNRLAHEFPATCSVREARRRGFNLTEVAQALHTSQPGVSRQIRELEDELGIEIFVRAGKRLTGLTEPGRHVLPIVERLLHEAENLRRAGTISPVPAAVPCASPPPTARRATPCRPWCATSAPPTPM